MNVADQGVESNPPEEDTGRPPRYRFIPRTLIFLTSTNPATGGREVLLLQGAADKRLWANRYNGLGGHVEPDEDLLAAARREVEEEAGISGVDLTLRGIINIATSRAQGVGVFVFHGEAKARSFTPSREGNLTWVPLERLADYPLVDDLHQLLPAILNGDGLVYGHYVPRADGSLSYRLRRGQGGG